MSSENEKKEIDQLSGVETTGHEWDGLKELNNPLPRWWLWVFYATVIWSVWVFVVYPAWPTPGGATAGTSGYTQYKELAESQSEIKARQALYLARFEKASFAEIQQDAELYAFALAGGQAAFKDNCATCHGTGAEGGTGYPNLNDDDWIWGGSLSAIHATLKHGIRAQDDAETRISQMPAYGREGVLDRAQISDVVDYVLALSSAKAVETMPGHATFQEHCAACHGPAGDGGREFGAPRLNDAIWLYGGTREEVFHTIYHARAGMMPAWERRLNPQTLRQLAVYVHELGGGEPEPVENAPTAAPAAPADVPEVPPKL